MDLVQLVFGKTEYRQEVERRANEYDIIADDGEEFESHGLVVQFEGKKNMDIERRKAAFELAGQEWDVSSDEEPYPNEDAGKEEAVELNKAGEQHFRNKEHLLAAKHFKQARSLARRLGEPGLAGKAGSNLGATYKVMQRPLTALRQYERAIPDLEQDHSVYTLSVALHGAMTVSKSLKLYSRASLYAQQQLLLLEDDQARADCEEKIVKFEKKQAKLEQRQAEEAAAAAEASAKEQQDARCCGGSWASSLSLPTAAAATASADATAGEAVAGDSAADVAKQQEIKGEEKAD